MRMRRRPNNEIARELFQRRARYPQRNVFWTPNLTAVLFASTLTAGCQLAGIRSRGRAAHLTSLRTRRSVSTRPRNLQGGGVFHQPLQLGVVHAHDIDELYISTSNRQIWLGVAI